VKMITTATENSEFLGIKSFIIILISFLVTDLCLIQPHTFYGAGVIVAQVVPQPPAHAR